MKINFSSNISFCHLFILSSDRPSVHLVLHSSVRPPIVVLPSNVELSYPSGLFVTPLLIWPYVRSHGPRSSRGESTVCNSPGFQHFCARQVMEIFLFLSHSCSFSFSFYLLDSSSLDGMLINRKKRHKSQNEAEKDKITWTAVHRNCISGTIRLTAVSLSWHFSTELEMTECKSLSR